MCIRDRSNSGSNMTTNSEEIINNKVSGNYGSESNIEVKSENNKDIIKKITGLEYESKMCTGIFLDIINTMYSDRPKNRHTYLVGLTEGTI